MISKGKHSSAWKMVFWSEQDMNDNDIEAKFRMLAKLVHVFMFSPRTLQLVTHEQGRNSAARNQRTPISIKKKRIENML